MNLERKTIVNDEKFLRQISKEVDFLKKRWKTAVKEMKYFCYNEKDIESLSAVQIGVPLRMIYLKEENIFIINPKVIEKKGKTRYWESCASCLNNTALVERPYKITLEYYDEKQNKHIETFEGLTCTLIDHELDHLDGILHIDKSNNVMLLNDDERKTFRINHPYEVINYE